MIHKNDILRYESGEVVRFMRVLWQTSSGKEVFLIDVDANKAQPVAIEIAELEEDLAKGRCFLHAKDTWQRLVDEAHLSVNRPAFRGGLLV